MSKGTVIVGFDAGNSEANLVLGHGRYRKTLTIPSFIGDGSLDELNRIRSGGGRSEAGLLDGEYVLEAGHQSYFVGELALAQARQPESYRGSVSRYWSGHSLRLLMVLAGTLIKDKKFSVRVVTGLPVQVWSNETALKVANNLSGCHTFVLNGQTREMTVEGVLPIMEGAGALIAYGSDQDEHQAVIDVGGETTDLFWAFGQEPVLPKCQGLSRGVEAVGDLLKVELKRTRALSSAEVRSILRAHAAGETMPQLYAAGQPLKLNGEVSSAIQGVGMTIQEFVSRTWRSGDAGSVANEARTVLLIGGGAHYFEAALKQIIPHLRVPPRPELANAEGYCDLGHALDDDAWYV